ncbi:MAG: hypothetical protein CMJ50_09405 [Planctomycetaceae bacterium]|nr:hypothetical protein [Planctomycetaceae bacterium]
MALRPRSVVVTLLVVSGVAVAVVAVARYRSTPASRPRDLGSRAKTSTLPRPAPRDDSYVGSQACADCHKQIFHQFSASPMGQSMATVDQAVQIEDYESNVIEPSKKRRYKMTRDGKHATHYEIMLDEDGELLFEHGEVVRFVLGSGRRGRSYLINRDGLLFQSPIGWYSQLGHWDLSPGYAPHNHPRFSRQIDDGCLYCHAGRMNYQGTADNHYAEPVFAEIAIGCERCHGPGERHVQLKSAAALKLAGSDPFSDPIINPKKLDPSKRDSVCFQCHLLGQSLITRYGRGFFDFRPGDDLEDVFVVLSQEIGAESDGTLAPATQIEQMRASRCYQAADGALGCTSCHNAHSTPIVEQRAEYYRLRCLACHETNDCKLDLNERELASANNSCIHCHMPALPVRGIPHTALTDHRILRHGRESDQPSERGSEKRTDVTVFDHADERLPRAEIDRAKGIALMTKAWRRRGDDLAARALSHLLKVWTAPGDDVTERLAEVDDVPFLEELGAGYMLLGNSDLAVECWSRVLKLDPRSETALKGVAKVAEERQDLQAFGEHLEKLVEVNPWSDEVFSLRVKHRFYSKDLPGAAREAERALEINPTLVELRSWLANTYRELGDEERAKQQLEFLKKLGNAPPVNDD